MNRVNYALMDPTGNRTVLVTTPVPPAQRPAVAAALMGAEPTAEQLGFVTAGEAPALTMAGGEFCGNASMAAAALLRPQGGRVLLRVSGTPAPVPVEITPAPGGWRGRVAMPLPLRIGVRELPSLGSVPVVELPGITHIPLTAPLDRAAAEALIRPLCRQLAAPALGLLLTDGKSRMTPLVYVPAADTLFWESSCASGTAAVGAWQQALLGTPVRLTLQQPAGSLTVEADGSCLWLSGTVRKLYETPGI